MNKRPRTELIESQSDISENMVLGNQMIMRKLEDIEFNLFISIITFAMLLAVGIVLIGGSL